MLRALGLGDFLTAVPALRALHQAVPGHRLVLAAPEPLRPLVELSGVVDGLLPTGELEPVGWSGDPPEIAVNLHGRGPESHRLLRRLHPGRLVAFANGEAGEPGPQWRTAEHERSRWCRLVEESFDVRADPHDVGIAAPGVVSFPAGAVVVHPGAAYPARRWPPHRFAAVARWAAGRGSTVLVTGAPDEAELAEHVRREAGLPADAVLAGRTDLGQLAAVVASAAAVVCGDTGVAHLASSYRTPSVLLFGPTPPAAWGPPPGPHRVLWHGQTSGDPFGSVPDHALLEISVAEVVEHLEALLDERPAAPVPG